MIKNKAKTKASTPQVRIAKATFTRVLANRFFKVIGYFVLASLLAYLCIAATIMRVVPTTTAGPVVVKNITWEGGTVPAGEEVLVSMTHAQGSEMLDYLKQGFLVTTDASLIRVEAGPWGKFTWAAPGVVEVNGKILDSALPEKPESQTLNNAYLGTCIKGACVPGQVYVVSADNLLGDPISKHEKE